MISAAWPLVLTVAVLAGLLFFFHHPLAAMVPLSASAAIALFFRDPERTVPSGDDLVVAPADGKVVEVRPASESVEPRVAIFLSLLNVHVNRSPVAGTVRSVVYRAGSFRPAWEANASSINERNSLELESPGGRFGVAQIAGLVARRIHCFKKAGDTVLRGERIGYIAFGSRTELTLPPRADIVVRVGDHVRGGESVIARLPAVREPS